MSTAATADAVSAIPRTPESDRIRSWKCIGAFLGIDSTTAKVWARSGKLVLKRTGGERVPVVYEDHRGHWAPKSYLDEWVRAQERPVGPT